MLVPHDTLVELTGRARYGDQIAWLREHRWKFEVSATGRPVVALAEFMRKMTGEPPKASRVARLEAVR